MKSLVTGSPKARNLGNIYPRNPNYPFKLIIFTPGNPKSLVKYPLNRFTKS